MTERTASPEAEALDRADPLAPLRARFRLPLGPDGRTAVYLCGNSLGPMPRDAAARVQEVLELWSTLAVRGHHTGPDPWLHFHEKFAAPLARLVGAAPGEVVAMNTLTVNLHLLLVSFFRPAGARHRVLIERGAFPSDRHAIVSQLRYHGLAPEQALVEVEPRPGEDVLRTEDLVAAIDRAGDTLALVLLPGVQYRTGQVLDVATLTGAARRAGAVVGWDLAHAIGNVPVALHDAGADFAVWCHYKYLCAGPGAVAGAFVHERHARAGALPRFAGWWGHEVATRFAMGPDFVPAPGADGWQLSNPPVLALAPLAASLALFDEAGLPALRAKSLALTAFARARLAARLAGRVDIVTPAAESERGCQLSLRIGGGAAAGRATFERLCAAGVIGDWREPDVIRLAPAPLYNTFAEVERAIEALADALATP
ncbi:MAG: kynureninase [Proteobacteria bacterium]|nr:kynureninase [Pseudomonadota bacterium]